MKRIGFTLVIISVLSLSSNLCVAQGRMDPAGISHAGRLQFWQALPSQVESHGVLAPASQSDVAISYFDPKTSTNSWIVPAQWTPIVMVGFTERITLPADSGFVDSVSVVFDAISGDSIAVLLDPDTLILTPAGVDHLDATVFDQSIAPFGIGVIYPSKVTVGSAVMVYFPHSAVPKNFHVGIVPSSSTTGPTASYTLRGDNEPKRTRTSDNAHSTFIGVTQQGQLESGVIDSNLTLNGHTAPSFSNLYITAFVHMGAASVASSPKTSTIALYPNPASSMLEVGVAGSVGANSIEIFDMLGRRVLSQQLSINSRVDVSLLASGHYMSVVHTESGNLTVPVIIQR